MIGFKLYQKVKKYPVINLSILLGFISIATYLTWFLTFNRSASISKTFCIFDVIYIFHEIPRLIFEHFINPFDIPINFIGIFSFYFLSGILLHILYNKNKKIFVISIWILLVILSLVIIYSLYINCFFDVIGYGRDI